MIIQYWGSPLKESFSYHQYWSFKHISNQKAKGTFYSNTKKQHLIHYLK